MNIIIKGMLINFDDFEVFHLVSDLDLETVQVCLIRCWDSFVDDKSILVEFLPCFLVNFLKIMVENMVIIRILFMLLTL